MRKWKFTTFQTCLRFRRSQQMPELDFPHLSNFNASPWWFFLTLRAGGNLCLSNWVYPRTTGAYSRGCLLDKLPLAGCNHSGNSLCFGLVKEEGSCDLRSAEGRPFSSQPGDSSLLLRLFRAAGSSGATGHGIFESPSVSRTVVMLTSPKLPAQQIQLCCFRCFGVPWAQGP